MKGPANYGRNGNFSIFLFGKVAEKCLLTLNLLFHNFNLLDQLMTLYSTCIKKGTY